MASRVPVEHVCKSRIIVWKKWGFPCPSGVLTSSTYVHNLFSAGKSCYAACQILDDAELYLSKWWDLSIKPSSRQVMGAASSVDLSVPDAAKWPVVNHMEVLGRILQDDADQI